MNEFVEIEPLEVEDERKVAIAKATKRETAVGRVLSVGEGRILANGNKVVPPVKRGDIILYNPALLDDLEYKGRKISIINATGIYGAFK